MLTQSSTLVKYNNAKLVMHVTRSHSKTHSPSQEDLRKSETKRMKYSIRYYRHSTSLSRKAIENGNQIIREISTLPASKANVIELQEELDKRLQQLQIRETGFCPIREQLYQECFGIAITR
jgi:dynein light intermediate chain